jgi:hypothetical protein
MLQISTAKVLAVLICNVNNSVVKKMEAVFAQVYEL